MIIGISDFSISEGILVIDSGDRNNLDKLIKSNALLENNTLHLYFGVERFLVVTGSTKSFDSIMSKAIRYQGR